MVLRVCGDIDNLTVQGFHQCRVLALGIHDNHIAVPTQNVLNDLPLGKEGFTGAGHAENQAVAVLELGAIDENQVSRDLVSSAVDAFGMLDALCPERHECRSILGNHGTQRVDLAQPIRKRGVHTLTLLILQYLKFAAVLSAGREQNSSVRVQLLLAVRKMDQCHRHQLELLILLGQLCQKPLRLFLLLLDIKGNGRCPVEVLILLLRPLGGVGRNAEQDVIDLLDRFAGRD